MHSKHFLGSTARPLYPYHTMDLSVIFIYDTHQKLKFNDNLFSKLRHFLINWTNLFVILAAILLCIVRRWKKLRCDGFISVLIDVMVIFTGGGKLRMDHQTERWFFAVVSIGAFFLNAICLGPTLFPSYLLAQRSVNTFQELAQINPRIYIDLLHQPQENLIIEMIK